MVRSLDRAQPSVRAEDWDSQGQVWLQPQSDKTQEGAPLSPESSCMDGSQEP